MTDDPSSPGAVGPGGQDGDQEHVQPWFPPSPPAGGTPLPPGGPGQPGGWYPPPPGGYAQPGQGPATGQPGGWYPPPSGGYAQPSQGPTTGQPGGWYPPPPGGYAQPDQGPAYGQPGGWQAAPGHGSAPYGGWAAPAPKPGVIPLRPLAVGEILDGAFTSVRRNPKATLGLAAIVLTVSGVISTLLLFVLTLALGQSTPVPGESAAQAFSALGQALAVAIPVEVASLIITFAADVALTGLLTVVVGRNVLGQVVTIGQAWQLARSRLAAVLGVLLLTLLALLLPFLGAALVVVLALAAGAPTVLVLLLGVVLGLAAIFVTTLMSVMLKLTVPAVVLEHQRPVAALSRSWQLVRGSFWRVFGITLLTGLIVGIAAGLLQIPFELIAAIFGGTFNFAPGGGLAAAGTPGILPVLITTVGGIVAGTVTRPISAGVTVLLYVDLRIRREGFDLVLQGASAGTDGEEFASLWRPGAGSATAQPGPAQPAGQAGPLGPGPTPPGQGGGPLPPTGQPPAW